MQQSSWEAGAGTGSQWYHGESNGCHYTQYYHCNKCGAARETDVILSIPLASSPSS